MADVRNKAVLTDDRKRMLEKLKGRFDLRLNPHLPMGTKINMFSNEDVIFHLHKNRNFIEKIQKPVTYQKPASEVVGEVQKKLEEFEHKSKRALILANSNVTIADDEDSSDYDSEGRIKTGRQHKRHSWRGPIINKHQQASPKEVNQETGQQ